MNRTPETIAINNALEIVRLKGNKGFKVPFATAYPSGYCFSHPQKGYFAYKGENAPYTPCGGKKALISILEQGGFLNFDNAVWLWPN